MGDILSRTELSSDPQPVAAGRDGAGAGTPTVSRLLLAAIVALWAWVTIPWLTGSERLVLRDVLSTHAQYKYFGSEQLSEGRIPAINPTWALGQPYRGNPNTLAYYPGNLLYLVLPFQVAFHAHFALHWLLAFVGMWRLARSLGQSREAALLAGLTWAASGYVLSLLTFYNLLTVAAWAPLAMLGLASEGRRGVALAGFGMGMMILGGEPITAALLAPAMIAVSIGASGVRRGTLRLIAAGGVGIALALPQIVATLRVLPFVFRTVHGLAPAEAAAQGLSPWRLLELILPLPWGWPSDLAYFGFWSDVATPSVPYIYSLHVGVVGLALAAMAFPRRPIWTAIGLGALLFAAVAGLFPDLLLALTGGLFRYPQKSLVLFTFVVALTVGWGLDRSLGNPRIAHAIGAAGVLLLAGAAVSWLGRSALVGWLRLDLAEGQKEAAAATHGILWILALALAGLLLVATGFVLAHRHPALVVVLQLLGLLQLSPIVVTGDATELRGLPPMREHLASPMTLVPVPHLSPDWERRLPYPIEALTPAGQAQVAWFQLEPAFGVPFGLSYPLAPDLEGLTSPLHVFLSRNLQLASWDVRVRWLRRLGVGWVIRFDLGPIAGLERVGRFEQFGVPVELLRVGDSAPPARWPEALHVAPSPIHAYALASGSRVRLEDAVVSRPVPHHAGGRVDLVERLPDRWVIDVESDGGLVVVQTAWLPIWEARLESGHRLATQPVEVVLTGVEVPAGRHRVTLEVAAGPERAAGVLALMALAGTAWLGSGRRSAEAVR